MKLRQIKLAGFKTFVDATNVRLDGQLAGIVGPNGCGKSNIMESVKWVLGASSAKELRGDSMDDVIFSGTDTSKPLSRASVELLFDNRLGKAPAEWSGYTEISVKRVIEKDKGSTYLINNSAVRRKDVADLFLGTGLGTKGYAIIGQNTVSQIVEAKPEELKSFLEEAAGVSKYKERRKETEYRLRDTRNNLSRVQDLLREINQQILKLESQSQAANKYNELNENLALTQAQIWVLKKQKANAHWINIKEEIEQKILALEKQRSLLTSIEKNIEDTRQEFNEATDKINLAQASFYEKNSLVSDGENKLANLKDKIERQKNLKLQNQEKIEKLNELEQQLSNQKTQNESILADETKKSNLSKETLNDLLKKFESAEISNKLAINEYEQSNNKLQTSTEKLNISLTALEFIQNNIAELNLRIDNLESELVSLHSDIHEIKKPHELTVIEIEIKNNESLLDSNNKKNHDLITQIDALKNQCNLKKAEIEEKRIRISSLKEIIEQEVDPKKIDTWLNEIGSINHSNLIKSIDIKDGWERALGIFLGSKVEAYKTTKATVGTVKRPPFTITLIHESKNETTTLNVNLTSALTVTDSKDSTLKIALSEWLSNLYIAEEGEIDNQRKFLKVGEAIITKEGDIYGNSYQILNQPSNNKDNRLLRIKQLEAYEKDIPHLENQHDKLIMSLADFEVSSRTVKNKLDEISEDLKKKNEIRNQISFEYNKLINVFEVNSNRKNSITKEITELKSKLTQISQDQDNHNNNIDELKIALVEINALNNKALEKKLNAETIFVELRDRLTTDERSMQAVEFNIKLTDNKLAEINNRLLQVKLDREQLLIQIQEPNFNADDNLLELETHLKEKIKVKEEVELILIKARENLAEKDHKLKKLEINRLENQHLINPLNDSLQQTRLDEREAKLKFDICCEEINKTKYQESDLLKTLDEKVSQEDLENKTSTLLSKIERLGPVNLAAITELKDIHERQTYILAQVDDLQNASNILEQAIRKIDLETREKLMATYKTVNENFTQYFRTLFDGGRAELELLGNEILDTGLQVVAQPPGKKNTTIHLLSGGEKALTAIALVFALFKLNPSPFCLMDEVDAPLDDSNTERFCKMVKEMSANTQFLFVSHNKLTMEIAEQLIGVTMQEPGVSRIVEVDLQDIEKMELVD